MLDGIFKIFSMLGGLAIFMYGMKIMGDSLEALAGSKMKSMFARVSDNKLKGVGIGMGVTAVIQSSSATTVMLVGFVNIGFLSLKQSAAIIMGSNIGTTITAQLSSLSSIGGVFDITAIMSLLAIVGLVLFMFIKSDSSNHLGLILLGLGMLFIGLDLMSGSMKSFALNPDGSPSTFANFMLSSFSNPLICILAGMLFTAIIQSSSAATGILLVFASANIMTFETAMFMILGTNIGTCVTAMLSSIGTSTNAKRTAVIHLLFNVIGTAIVTIPLLFIGDKAANFFTRISGGNIERAIANFHTVFNILVTLILLPFTNQLVQLATLIVPKRENSNSSKPKRLFYLDERILATPSLAVAQTISEVKNMADMANTNLQKSLKALLTGDLDEVAEMQKAEETIDYLNIEITNYLIKFRGLDISIKDQNMIGSLYHVVTDIERIGDHAENIWKNAARMQKNDIQFSEIAQTELKNVQVILQEMYEETVSAFVYRDRSVLSKLAVNETLVDNAKRQMKIDHIERLNNSECSAEAGAIYLSIASQLERVGDHLANMAYSILSYEDKLSLGDIKAN